ncbi:MAG: ATP synthase F1 subunit epsilon [Chloroflexi bacterium]|nr:MAG: ATP synthase F1 subunit epsilon [Anaerolineaceae bacterium 4572_32.2]RLC75376.1 MAG: ATP synthase F1 subunit epsilon [Chloroflexota bacterium]RLC76024.1 MAG: ATP synthase F1 subunit epsilon [Chloroflexota bacterium]HEY72292.1 ATP synthase F1 subunit epsilon [Thermoflexia bacterium]
MTGLKLTIVSPEQELYSGKVDIVLAPGIDGQLGILPNHASLITKLAEGELCARIGAEEYYFAIHGGFMHVLPDEVIVLADVAERAGEIDAARAEKARQRALGLLTKSPPEERRLTEVALRRSQVRLKVARRRRRRHTTLSYPGVDDGV